MNILFFLQQHLAKSSSQRLKGGSKSTREINKTYKFNSAINFLQHLNCARDPKRGAGFVSIIR
jgi:hypothetical protein